ncbi:MAG TPA: alpha/beta hydrolase, partial [Candidatus Melainabacteria bacterium]|nr:alpha/beta hydrolase [Candidatus Melainabacteria bacterium]
DPAGPAVTVNPIMLVHPQSVFAGAWGLVIDPHFNVDLGFFMRRLVSQDTRIVSELENDPLIRKKMTILDLLRTDAYVRKNVKFARKLEPEIPLLILQGSKDRCVVPRRVTKLLGSVSSDDQTLRWMQHLSHLLLETKYINSDTVSAIASWIDAHEDKYKKELEALDKELVELGAESL